MVEKTLFVVIGAGASFDASSEFDQEGRLRPPLVPQLFERRWKDVLDSYPMAKNAAPEIRDALQGIGGPAVSIEKHLRQLSESADELDRRRFFSITLYLQNLLLIVS